MSEPKRPLKVFLCHSSSDKLKVRELYRYLKKRGAKPWFDEVDLVGGQDWQVEIPKAILTSDAIIICLTKNSVDKEGYIQKEIKFALDKALEMPEGRIFLIPVRFEECEVPFTLSRYQWVDLFDEVGYARMMKALKFRASQLERATVELPKNVVVEENIALEKIARENAEREVEKKDLLERAELEAAETAAREKAEREIAEKDAREKVERVSAEKAAREKAERETAEKATREKEKRDIAEKVKREKAEHQAARNAATKKLLSEAKPFFRIIGIGIVIITLFLMGTWAIPKFVLPVPTPKTTATQYTIANTSPTNSPVVPTQAEVVASPSPQPSIPRDAKIVFNSGRDDKAGFYLMDSDGSNVSLLTSNPAYEWDPTWSPDGKQIAFASDRDDPKPYECANIGLYTCNFEIYVMDAKGDNTVRLTNNPAYDDSPAWSPNGKQIAFLSDREDPINWNFGIYVMNADGTDVSLIKSGVGFGAKPTWSPDGKKIAYGIYVNGNSEIYVMNADGSGEVNLTKNSSYDSGSTWSPDGKYIAFASNRDDPNLATCGNGNRGVEDCDFEIYVMNADGGNVTRLTNSATGDQMPTWSPDGERIAFVSRRDGNSEIYLMNTDGSNQTNLTNNSADDWSPGWSPLP
jgi:Tol biopolymer transport system component